MNLRATVRGNLEIASDNPAVRLFQDALKGKRIKRYVKFGTVKARRAVVGERIDTIINGKMETTNIAKENDYVVENPGGEQYIIDSNKIASRYKKVGIIDKTWSKYKAIGECFGFEYQGKPFTFKAPWGEQMICEDRDMIVSTSPTGTSDVYRIEKEAFKATYKLAK